jgi:hypothetical protein
MDIPYDFWDSVEENNGTNIGISDTDSIIISIPYINCETTAEYVKKAEIVASDINSEIRNFLNKNVLTKMNISESNNETFFKTENVISAIMSLDVKKKYCLKEIANEKTIHETPIIKYTGLSIVRTNSALLTKDFMKELIENIALSNVEKTKQEVKKELAVTSKKYYDRLVNDIKVYNFDYIGVPCKWASTQYKLQPAEIVGMKLYNTLTEKDYFQENTSGKKVPIKINNINEFSEKIESLRHKYPGQTIENISIDKLNFLVVPIFHERDELENVFKKFGININEDLAWSNLIDTTFERIIKCIRDNSGI